MSAAALRWATAQTLPQTEKSVLKTLAQSFSPRWGYSSPARSRIAVEVGVTRETVNRTLKSLESKGIIFIGTLPRKKGQWDRKFYRLIDFQ